MEENISVEAEKCGTQLAERHIPQRHLPCSFISGEDFCVRRSFMSRADEGERVWHLAATGTITAPALEFSRASTYDACFR
jgi:hypothetical protein